MAHVSTLFKDYFVEYASYVVKERAIPYVEDGFKPVQRRIIHTLFEMDDGRMHKVATVVGKAMAYHPHGDNSIYEALVALESMKYFIQGGGSFADIITGAPASAMRYIECRIMPFAKKVLFSPKVTEYVPTYDSRNKEPVVFPAKLPVALLLGVEGIAVGMATKIMPYNPHEVIDAMKKAIRGEEFEIYPDFLTGGLLDVSEYDDGKGKISIRSKVEVNEAEKKLIIREIPYKQTTEKLIENIDKMAKLGKVKIQSINDFTAAEAHIELELQRGADPAAELESLYAYTDAEIKITDLNPLLIKDGRPTLMGVSEIIKYHAEYLQSILLRELGFEMEETIDKLQLRTLERIFIEERIYKKIEDKTTQEAINEVVISSLDEFHDEFIRELTNDDVKHLLELPIRRISLFDIEKNKKDIEELEGKRKEIENHQKYLKRYAISVLDDLDKSIPIDSRRKTQIVSFNTVKIKDVIRRDLSLKYNKETGQIGYDIKQGEECRKVSELDKILIVQGNGCYRVIQAPDKLYVGKDLVFVDYADRDLLQNLVFTIIFREEASRIVMIKRCRILQYTLNKLYSLLPDGNYKVIRISTFDDAMITLEFKTGRNPMSQVYFSDYQVKGATTQGVQLSRRDVTRVKIRKLSDGEKKPVVQTPDLFSGDSGKEK